MAGMPYRPVLQLATPITRLSVMEGLTLEADRAVLRMRNPVYDKTPQAIGRAARAMTRVLPASVETFVIVPVVNGMPISAVEFSRSDIERLENSAASAIAVQ